MLELKDLCESSDLHNYYCDNGKEPEIYPSWRSFKKFWFEEIKNELVFDFNYNLLFRFDFKFDKDNCFLELFFVQQRKGRLKSVIINNIKQEDVDEIVSFLRNAKYNLDLLWQDDFFK